MSSSDRLHRSKSTRTIRRGNDYSRPTEPFDPGIARLHATTAASLAMSRSSMDRSSTLSEGSYGRVGGPHNLAVPQRKHRVAKPIYTPDDPSRAGESPTYQPSLVLADSPNDSQNRSAALPSISEFGGLENRIASLPSSYRRLRKTRSMFSARQRTSHTSHGSPVSEYAPPTMRSVMASETPKSYRSLRRSISFLRGDPKPSSTLRHAKSHDAAIQLARRQYQQNVADHAVPPLPPLPKLRTRREHKPFRKTFRATSASTKATNSPSPVPDKFKDTSSQGKARSFSHSLKKGIKRVLGLSRSLPNQERVETSLPPLPVLSNDAAITSSRESNYHSEDRACYQDSNHGDSPIGLCRQSTVRKRQSCESLATTRSRVTSWADSTATNTIATPKTGGQRLSIIDEQYGPHQIHPESVDPSGRTALRRDEPIDSHRLFSALMKRIGRGNTPSPDEDILLGRVNEHRAVRAHVPSNLERSRQIIRQIPSTESVSSRYSFATAHVGSITPQRHAQDVEQQAHIFHVSRKYGAGGSADHTSEADSKIAIVRQSESEPDSPSVYSRITGGGTSPKLQPSSNSPEAEEELGVATIFASERTAYSSPKRASSSDWQHWMDSQMERIENLTPTKHHYREDAQIQDECDRNFPAPITSRKIEADSRAGDLGHITLERPAHRISTSSNFSRPFSRSSSVRTIIIGPQDQSISTPLTSNLTSTPQPLSQYPIGQEYPPSSTYTRDGLSKMSPMQSRSGNKLRALESPTPKRDMEGSARMYIGAHEQLSTKWSPVSQDGKAIQLRNARTQRDNRRANNENSKLERNQYIKTQMSSKNMVDMFLNSRRRQTGTEISDGSSERAFL